MVPPATRALDRLRCTARRPSVADRIRSRTSYADRRTEGDRGGRAPGGARARGRRQAEGQRPRRRSCRAAPARTRCCATPPTPTRAPQISSRRGRGLGLATSSSRSRRPTPSRSAALGQGSILIGFLAPLTSPQTTRALADAGATAFAMEAIPRISRAQSMDALSSQSNVAGYRAALLGAEEMGRFYPDADDRGGHDPAGQGARARRRRRRAAGARHRQAPGRAHDRLRRAPRGRRAGRVARRAVARPRPRGQRRGRLRARADRGGARAPAAGADRCDQGLRRGHHDRARAGPPGAAAGHRRGGRGHEAGLGDRRPGRRGGRQLRADRARARPSCATTSRSSRR